MVTIDSCLLFLEPLLLVSLVVGLLDLLLILLGDFKNLEASFSRSFNLLSKPPITFWIFVDCLASTFIF